MWALISVIVCCVTVYLTAKMALTRGITIAPVITLRIQQGLAEKDPSTPEPIVAPGEVLQWCALENSEFAREAMLEKARGLYDIHGDWGVAFQHLRQAEGEFPSQDDDDNYDDD